MAKTERLSTQGIDETDTRILRVLLENSKLSYRQIAKKVMISVATVMHRVNKLESSGVIKKYSVQLDYEKLGYELVALVEIRVSKGKLFEVERLIARHPNAQSVYDVTGGFDAVVICKFRNRRELDAFVKKVQTYEFVERTETRLVLNVIKEEMLDV